MFKSLFHFLDGKTIGNVGFQGLLGRALVSLRQDNAFVDYETVPGKVETFDNNVVANLSSDQQHLYQACQSVTQGLSPPISYFGNYHPAHWLTLCNQAISHYVTTARLTRKLQKLVIYITNVYAPMWFATKTSSGVSDGSRLFFKPMQLVSSCPLLSENDKNCCKKTLQNNTYFAHPEWLLLSMLTDKQKTVRCQAIKMIQDTQGVQTEEEVRTFTKPTLCQTATEYTEMIAWATATPYEPPLTKMLSSEELKVIADKPYEIPPYPCHNRTVEHIVQDVVAAQINLRVKS